MWITVLVYMCSTLYCCIEWFTCISIGSMYYYSILSYLNLINLSDLYLEYFFKYYTMPNYKSAHLSICPLFLYVQICLYLCIICGSKEKFYLFPTIKFYKNNNKNTKSNWKTLSYPCFSTMLTCLISLRISHTSSGFFYQGCHERHWKLILGINQFLKTCALNFFGADLTLCIKFKQVSSLL